MQSSLLSSRSHFFSHTDQQHSPSITPTVVADRSPKPSEDLQDDSDCGDSAVDTLVQPTIECDICDSPDPNVCCFSCDPKGVPYHSSKECWGQERRHRKNRRVQNFQIHEQAPIASLVRHRYLNEPNEQESIPDETFKEDKSNCFIEFNLSKKRFEFGDRAFPLLPNSDDQIQYPSFVSFVGPTMNGKSFLIRALQSKDAAGTQPSPIPSPGKKRDNHDSTSSDIHLYPDLVTTSHESPILFLDCEGCDGTDVPSSLKAEGITSRSLPEAAYPRLVYAFSTCIVYVTTSPLAASSTIKDWLIKHAQQGASGSRNQGFKPSLFIIFNQFQDDRTQDFDWSIDTSTTAFLRHDYLAILEKFYSSIRVVYIPRIDSDKAIMAQDQLDAFGDDLREKHQAAFELRKKFRLNFKPVQLALSLQTALDRLTKDSNAVVDWALEAPPAAFSSAHSHEMLVDLWSQYLRHHTPSTHPQTTPYNRVREDFQKHITFCLRLRLRRNSLHFDGTSAIPSEWDDQIDQLTFEYANCGAVHNHTKCKKVRYRHGEYHEDSEANRWQGEYTPDRFATSQKFSKSFEGVLQSHRPDVSLDELWEEVPADIRSVVSCLGCLQQPPSTLLACGHGFCLDCIRDLTHDESSPHRLKNICCPIHRKPQTFSPRLLPIHSGYRILSLDGGGVKGLAQLVMLSHIEKRCFDVPAIHLFDLVVGTSIGGLIALALTIGKPSGPLTVAATKDEFPQLIRTAFEARFTLLHSIPLIFNKTLYKATPLANCLKKFFGEETKLYSALQSSVPNVAVTTTVLSPSEAHLVTNYNRTSMDKTLLFGPTPAECMPVWEAARCTSAAPPYFKPVGWRGKWLLDGALKLNCPAARALSEAGDIWPGKQCDILLSLGTGTTPSHSPSPNLFSVGKAVADDMVDTQKAWAEFLNGHPQSNNLLRLNPLHRTAFILDDVKKLKEIQKQTEEWIVNKGEEVDNICDRLIAALFFFCPSNEIHDGGVQVGRIFCRLPPTEGSKLIDRILQKAGSPLFTVKYNGETLMDIVVDRASGGPPSSDEPYFEVTCPGGIPTIGDFKMDVEMRSFRQTKDSWLPISGSPYNIREKRPRLDRLVTLRKSSSSRNGPRSVKLTTDAQPAVPVPRLLGS